MLVYDPHVECTPRRVDCSLDDVPVSEPELCAVRINNVGGSSQAGRPLFQFRGIANFCIRDSLITGIYMEEGNSYVVFSFMLH